MGKKKKGAKGKKGGGKKGSSDKGGGKKKGKKGGKKKGKKDGTKIETEEIIILPEPASWTKGTNFVEEFLGETTKVQLDNTKLFRTYRRKPKSLLVADELAKRIQEIEMEEREARIAAGLPPIEESGAAASSSATSVSGGDDLEDGKKFFFLFSLLFFIHFTIIDVLVHCGFFIIT